MLSMHPTLFKQTSEIVYSIVEVPDVPEVTEILTPSRKTVRQSQSGDLQLHSGHARGYWDDSGAAALVDS